MRVIPIFIVCLVFCACSGGYVESVTQKSEKGFLKFTGNAQSVTVSIDGKDAFPLVPAKDSDKEVVYEVKPGNHRVTVFRNNQMIVDRTVYVDNQVTMEINIP